MSQDKNSRDEEFRRAESVLRHHASGRHPTDSIHLDHHRHDSDKGDPEHDQPGKHDHDVKEKKSLGEILRAAGMRALGGGVPGAVAMGLQVGCLMWMRTTMNYQYRNGGSTANALRTLYAEGGIGRFYRGVGPALFQGPVL